MESNLNKISVDIPNYSGPLEVLLDLAKTQKVDLFDISITKLADQFLEFIKENENLNLETASEFLLMATWLAYLKSKLLLPETDEEEFKALEVAEKLKIQLKKLELIRSKFENKYSCSLFDIGCTSFFPTKPLGCFGDGGAIFTNNKKIYK